MTNIPIKWHLTSLIWFIFCLIQDFREGHNVTTAVQSNRALVRLRRTIWFSGKDIWGSMFQKCGLTAVILLKLKSVVWFCEIICVMENLHGIFKHNALRGTCNSSYLLLCMRVSFLFPSARTYLHVMFLFFTVQAGSET